MALDKADLFPWTGWYLISNHGDLTARVHAGMHLGEDLSGDLSFKPEDASIELSMAEDGGLVVRPASDAYQLDVPGSPPRGRVEIRPSTQARISFLNTSLLINTDISHDAPERERLDIRAVPAMPRPDGQRAGSRIARGPLRADTRAFAAAARELRALNKRGQVPGEETDRLVSDVDILMSEVLPGKPAATPVDFLQQEYAVSTANRRAERSAPGPDSGLPPNFPFITVVTVVSVIAIGFIYLLLQSPGEPPAVASDGADPAAPLEAAARLEPAAPLAAAEVTDTRLLLNVAALLDADGYPDPAATSFALRSLTTLAEAYPDDPNVNQSLARLTGWLASEARLSYDRGDTAGAATLIEQASATGVAQDQVTSAVAYLLGAGRVLGDGAALTGGGAGPLRLEPAAPAGVALSAPRPVPMLNPRVAVAPVAVADQVTGAEIAGAEVVIPEVVAPPGAGAGAPAASTSSAPGAADPVSGSGPVGVLALGQSISELESGEADLSVEIDNPGVSPRSDGLALELAVLAIDDTGQAPIPRSRMLDIPADDVTVEDLMAEADRRWVDAGRSLGLYPLSRLRAIRQDAPRYPRVAPEGAAGSVDLEFTVSETGSVRDVEVLGDAPRYFTRAARRAVHRWEFEPVIRGGEPVAVRTTVRMTFRAEPEA